MLPFERKLWIWSFPLSLFLCTARVDAPNHAQCSRHRCPILHLTLTHKLEGKRKGKRKSSLYSSSYGWLNRVSGHLYFWVFNTPEFLDCAFIFWNAEHEMIMDSCEVECIVVCSLLPLNADLSQLARSTPPLNLAKVKSVSDLIYTQWWPLFGKIHIYVHRSH